MNHNVNKIDEEILNSLTTINSILFITVIDMKDRQNDQYNSMNESMGITKQKKSLKLKNIIKKINIKEIGK